MSIQHYRTWNSTTPQATVEQMEALDDAHPRKRNLKRLSKSKPMKFTRRYSKVNNGYKLAMVALRFGSLLNTSDVK